MERRIDRLFAGVGLWGTLALAGCASGSLVESTADGGPVREGQRDTSSADGSREPDASDSDAAGDTAVTTDSGTADVTTDTTVADAPDSSDADAPDSSDADAPDSSDATDTGGSTTCRPEDVAPCDEANQNLCLETSCDGVAWYCTAVEGSWAWRTSAACSDSQQCTQRDSCLDGLCGGNSYTCTPESCPADRCEGADFIDVAASCDRACDGAGGCEACACEETSKRCATGAGNVCCEATCNPGSGCATRAGSCGVDQCGDPNLLRLAGACTGCGPEGAAGTCGAEQSLRCDATVQTPCAAVSCGGTLYNCTNAGGSWQWRTGATCDDGNACTYGDSCSAGSCRGSALTCNSTACIDRSCNGSATCTEVARTGIACDDGNACTTGDSCNASGACTSSGSAASCGDGACTCGETNASCPGDCPVLLPANACANGSQNRDRCSGARIIGRSSAAASWTSGVQNTCSASDRHDDACPGFDVGNDHSYAIYVKAGERVSANLTTTTTRCATGEEFRSFLKFKFNPDATSAGAAACPSFVLCAAGPGRTDSYATARTYDATADGWLFVIIDGGATVYDEYRGYYNLTVSLSRCSSANCSCP
jgi:hypothetical protein